VDGLGGLFQTLAAAFAGLFSGAARAFAGAIQGVFGALQSILPGLWLPAVAIAVVILVGWNLARR
jgi:hypothetical protein